ncbi:MAG: thioesterase family protein [Candidatus Palauibacterales bacterium]|nr:thioesterase family protein [Candidatus Palauibacterales bacterium]MDP2530222.1 thioesterase family protein [Candidatus Palauibacterales bacterium]MDP2584607.1 thioesterase family protein [Candidatus Palauibacterales bacterium]
MSTSTIRLRVRYGETDQMGRAHHSHYLLWCEEGRTQWLRERGVSYAELEADGVLLPVSRVAVAYREAAGYEEEIEVVTRLEEVRSRSVTFGYRVRRASDGATLAEARTELVCMDRSGRVRRLSESLRELLSEAVVEGRTRSGDGR